MGQGLLDPWLLCAVMLLVINDHVLKRHYGGIVTGKLSDVAGLAFFSAFLQALVEIAGRRVAWRGSRPVLLVATLATAAVFSWVKLCPVGAETYRVVLGALVSAPKLLVAWTRGQPIPELSRASLVRDWTDLLALPAVLLPLWLDARQRRSYARLEARKVAAGVVAAVALLVAPAARADPYVSIATGIGVARVTSAGDVQSSTPERAAKARYSASIMGVGPVGQLALGGQWSGSKFGTLFEAGYYRGHSWGSTEGLVHIGTAVDSGMFAWFWGFMGELPLEPWAHLGLALGFTGFRHRFEGAPVHRLYDPRSPVGSGVALKVWLAGEFDIDLGPSFRFGWRCPLSFTWSGMHRLGEGDREELGGPNSAHLLFELKYR